MGKNNNLILNSDEISGTQKDKFTKAIRTLEFDKVLDLLCSFCTMESAKDKIFALSPSVSPSKIKNELDLVSEAKNLVLTKSAPSFSGAKDITHLLDRAKKGSSLNMGELLEISSLLRVCASANVYFDKVTDVQLLYTFTSKISANKYLEERISTSIIAEDMMADNASPKLYDIRRKIKAASSKVHETLQKIITGNQFSKYLQENIITTRSGRYVIPVKAEYKNEIKGLIHDSSASGATVFIEPMGVIEANNTLRTLYSEEKAEIERILYELTSEVLRFSESLVTSYNALSDVAVIFAKASFSVEYNCSSPVINDKKYIRLNKARHILLDRQKAVPIDVYLGKSFTTLVITGPNTGGKTVTLKTIGLMCLMTQCGMHIPCEDGSTLPILDGILADIGDEQSIEQSLSTFSAHMVNIVEILKCFTENSLILFDELGAGTDPVEGAALAQSILEIVTEKGALCGATTHYAELKAYALESQKVTNASCEFDVKTLKPTYRLSIGMPGRSNAFAIARRLGLSEEIIKNANSKIDSESRNFEKIIGDLEKKRLRLEADVESARKMKKDAEEMFEKCEKQRLEFNARMEKEQEKAQKKADELLSRARESAHLVFDKLQEIQRQKDAENFKEALAKSRDDVRQTLGIASQNTGTTSKIELEYTPPRDYKVGDNVILSTLGKNAVIESIDGENASVLIGSVHFKAKIKDLRLIEEKNVKKEKSRAKSSGKSMFASSEKDVRGLIGDDAIFVIDKFLDDAVVCGLETVRIIHGKGTGALRKALWDYFKRDSRIKSYRLGTFGEGDAGVTVVTLKG